MSHQTRTHRTKLTDFATGPWGLLIMLFGPLATVVGCALWGRSAVSGHIAALVLVAFFVPVLPIGAPALLLQDVRDSVQGPHRTARLMRVLYTRSDVAPISWANLVGLVLAVVSIPMVFGSLLP